MSMQIGKGTLMSATQVTDQGICASLKTPAQVQPEPLLRPKKTGKPFPSRKIGPLKGPVDAIATLTNAPIEIAFQSVLATAALATQHIADVETLAGDAPLSLFLLTVAASGERKSSCDKLAIKAIQDWEAEEEPGYCAKKTEHDFQLSIYEDLLRKARKEATSEGAVIDTAAPQPPEVPIRPVKLLSDPTFEGILRHFEDGDPSVGIFADEGGQFFGGAGMNKDNQLKTVAGLSKLWDAAPLNRTRASVSQATYRNRRGSLHMMIQPRIAETVLSDETLKDQGFLARTLIAWPESRIGTRQIVVSDEEEEKRDVARTALKAHNQRLATLLRRTDERHGNGLEVMPRRLRLSREARNLLIRFANRVEVEQAPYSSCSHITGFASKVAEQAARLAGVLTLYSDGTAECISLTMMEDAIALAVWYLNEAQRLFDTGFVDPNLARAQKLLDWLKVKRPDSPFNRRDLVRNGPSSFRDTKTIAALLTILEQHGRIRQCTGGALIGNQYSNDAWELSDRV
ncbi:YfjI family protein [Salipiger bermudensis]|uniref:YfjI family protein n=1 Tax=Salipiger bermudensis TaxID=344736 RepID=UPI001CD7E35D|nr:YfjI family protein [Salipiger bermudensis]MCA1288162.1 DUF3987 domain-containing protein [Salipiger bermudensis]